jgi:hypothetical protein
MKLISFLLFLFSLNIYSITLGDYLEYEYRSIGEDTPQIIRESVTKIDEDFLSHLVKVEYTWGEYVESWRADDSYFPSYSAADIVDWCEDHGIGKFEVMNIENRPYVTCKIKSPPSWVPIRIMYDHYYNQGSSVVWIGEGPYNGIFKVIDHHSKTMYKLKSFQ